MPGNKLLLVFGVLAVLTMVTSYKMSSNQHVTRAYSNHDFANIINGSLLQVHCKLSRPRTI